MSYSTVLMNQDSSGFPPPSPLSITSTSPYESRSPLLSQYDPYHRTTYYVQHPFSEPPTLKPGLDEKLLGGKVGDGGRGVGGGVGEMPHLFNPPVWDPAKTYPSQPPKLDYQDFVATIQGLHNGNIHSSDTFSDIVDRANGWLRQNPNVQVRTCETVTWCSVDPVTLGDTEAVKLHSSPATGAGVTATQDNYYICGLRLWLVPSTSGEAVKLQHIDYTAESTAETLSQLVKRINRQLEDYPLTGRILNVETVLKPDFQKQQEHVMLWRDKDLRKKEHSLVLRVMVVQGDPHQETLGLKNICPSVCGDSHEPFSSLMKAAAMWLRDERGIHVLNMRSCLVYRDNDCPEQCAERTHTHLHIFSHQQYFQILRVFYARKLVSAPTSYARLCYSVTFTPVQTTPGKNTETDFELMKQTIVRTTAWLKSAEATVFNVETFQTPMISSIQTQALSEVTYWTPSMTNSEQNTAKYITHIRVYLDGDYKDPDPRTLPPLPQSLTYGILNAAQRETTTVYRKARRKRKKMRTCIIAGTTTVLLASACVLTYMYTSAFDSFL